MLWRCWLGGRKGIRPVNAEWWSAGVVICLERGADLYMAQLMPLPLTVSCFSKIQTGFAFLVLAHPGFPEKGPLNGCECVCVCLPSVLWHCWLDIMKSTWPVKIIEWWGVGMVICQEWGADCLHMVQLMPLHPKTPSSLASFKSRLVLPLLSWKEAIKWV